MILIKKSALEACLAGARSASPNEFIGLLEGEREDNGDILIERVVLPPGLAVSESSSSFFPWMVPASINQIGLFHSHPRGPNTQSRADAFSASKEGGVQLIACRPFDFSSVAVYDPRGKRMMMKIV
ncbi:MAG: Mov34/MPN/PAD-1 family protein [Candidatus Micrarchaeota archaeon]